MEDQTFTPVLLHRTYRKLIERSIRQEVRVPAMCGEKILVTERRDDQGQSMFSTGDTVQDLTILCPECEDIYGMLFDAAA